MSQLSSATPLTPELLNMSFYKEYTGTIIYSHLTLKKYNNKVTNIFIIHLDLEEEESSVKRWNNVAFKLHFQRFYCFS